MQVSARCISVKSSIKKIKVNIGHKLGKSWNNISPLQTPGSNNNNSSLSKLNLSCLLKKFFDLRYINRGDLDINIIMSTKLLRLTPDKLRVGNNLTFFDPFFQIMKP